MKINLDDFLNAAITETIADAKSRAESLLKRAEGEDAQTVETALRRIAQIGATMLLGTEASKKEAAVDIQHLVGTLESIAIKHQIIAQKEALEFLHAVAGRAASIISAAAGSLIPR